MVGGEDQSGKEEVPTQEAEVRVRRGKKEGKWQGPGNEKTPGACQLIVRPKKKRGAG